MVNIIIFQWHPELETGIELIDQQHKQIVQNCNTFFIRYKCRQGAAAIQDCLDFLQQYIQYHFQTEEAFQVECRYPGYRLHQALHKDLATRVKFFSVQLADTGYAEEVADGFYSFLIQWLQKHLMEEDRKFAACYRGYLEKERAAQ